MGNASEPRFSSPEGNNDDMFYFSGTLQSRSKVKTNGMANNWPNFLRHIAVVEGRKSNFALSKNDKTLLERQNDICHTDSM